MTEDLNEMIKEKPTELGATLGWVTEHRRNHKELWMNRIYIDKVDRMGRSLTGEH